MNAERLLALYERVAEAPDAITRLRRFILDLAVRGKLVPQEPNDEPASELLKRIAKEKARLVKVGTISRDKPLPQLTDADIVFELPRGWKWARLGHLTMMVTSGSRDWAKHYSNEGAIFVRMGNLSKDHYRLRLDHIQRVKAPSDGEGTRTRLEPGDILISITGDVGMLGLIPEGFGEAYINQHTAMVRPMAEMKGRYLAELFRSPFAQGQFNKPQRGIKNSFRLTDVTQFVVPLPPLAEQHRIVAKVDELMELCDRLEAARKDREAKRDRLSAASLARLNTPDPETFTADARFTLEALPALTTRPNQIKQLRQTILNLAVRGKLVPQDPNDEPASELLKRIAKEKAQFQKDPRKESLAEHAIHDPLPDSWKWSTLGDLSLRLHYGYTASAEPNIRDVRLLRITDIQEDQVDWDSVPGCTIDPTSLPNYLLDIGDILIARTGGTVGKTFLVLETPVRAVFASYLIRLRPARAIFARYVKCFCGSDTYWKQLYDGSRGAGQPNVNGQTLSRLSIPLPPLAEQHRIVAKVDELMALCDRLEASLTTSDQTCTRLLEATLTEALAPATTEYEEMSA